MPLLFGAASRRRRRRWHEGTPSVTSNSRHRRHGDRRAVRYRHCGECGSEVAAGTWVGTYTCRQGLTGLQLDIDAGEENSLAATFAFYTIDSNPDVPSGKFTMRGTYSDAGIELIQDTWIQQPAGYEMVDLRSRSACQR